ncbi:hypothetical protein OROHE_010908 [Orobanche hederae]
MRLEAYASPRRNKTPQTRLTPFKTLRVIKKGNELQRIEELSACQAVTIMILIVHILFPMTYEGCSIFWKSYLNRLKNSLLLMHFAG